MKTTISFAAVALAGAAQATFQTLNILVDGQPRPTYYMGQRWSEVFQGSSPDSVEIMMNNNIFLKEEPNMSHASDVNVDLRGGSMTYTVDVSDIDCGCVAGAYLVQTNGSCTQDPYNKDIPQCKTIDVMSANIRGFNVEAHPCERGDGKCDEHSRCQYDMLQDGIAKYGSDAYGPNGSLIDTQLPFEVRTEFLSTADKQTVWGLKSTLSQDGRSMDFSADCRYYIEDLSSALNGDMSVVFSTWSNIDNRVRSFKRSDACPAVEPACNADDSVTFSNVSFLTFGSNEDPPAMADATFQALPMTTLGTSQIYYAKGRDGRDLETAGSELIIGEDNRAFVWEVEDCSTADNAYEQDLFGGSLAFNADVTRLDEGCAGAVSLVNLDDQNDCSTADVEAGICKPTKLFEANKHAFNINFSENCKIISNESWYRPDVTAHIDSLLPYDIEFKFFASADFKDMTRAVMVINQDNARVTLTKECASSDFKALKKLLKSGVNLEITNMALDDPAQFSGIELHERCVNPQFGVGNIRMTAGDAVEIDPTDPTDPTFVFESIAEKQNMGACGDLCAVCDKGHMSNDTSTKVYQCREEGLGTVFYDKPCKATTSAKKNLCNHDSTQPCFWSWSVDENKEKDNKLKRRCRNLPDSYDNTQGTQEWYYDEQSAHKKNKKKGLCALAQGCATECLNSWPLDDPLDDLSPYAMIRCVPESAATE